MTNPQSTQNQPRINASDRLGFTLFLALAIHAIVVLGIGFTKTKRPDSNALPSLDIILANSRSLEPVDNPDFLSQLDQAGGGESDEKARPSAPVSANTPFDQQGLANQARAELQKNQLQINELYFISQQRSDTQINQQVKQPDKFTESKHNDESEQRQSRIARLQAEIRQMKVEYAKRPRVTTLTASTKKAVEAGYLASWVQKIESTGNLNYPAEARVKKLGGQLRMSVRLNAAGKVLGYKITHSSGSSLLDEAAKRILRLAEPFAAFPEEMRQQTDHVVIIRTWEFKSNEFNTGSGVS
ncbi:MAG: energy transducer TonB [Gammaproteobacteria bacterium]|nr:energy transducer TonB [Gammaproteobacteria bacterium]